MHPSIVNPLDESQDIKGIQPIGGYQGHVPRKALLEGSVGTVDEEATRNGNDVL